MPLLGRKPFTLAKPLTNVDPSETIYTIKHTQEQFKSKEEYTRRLSLYEDPVWTCQCTGHINMTHEDATQSEQEKYELLKAQFSEYYEKPVLELVHHSTTALDGLVDQAWTRIQQAFVMNEPVALKVKSSGNAVKGKVIKIDTSTTEQNKNCNSPSSDKENTGDASSATAGSPRKWTPPKLLPYKYSIKLDGEEKIISSIPAEHLVRDVRPPAKDLIKLFIRSFGLRFGANGLGPWVVSEEYVKKYSLPSKYADFLLSPSKMALAAKKAEAESSKKRKSTSKLDLSPTKKSKLNSQNKDKKSSKLKNSSILKSSNNLPRKPGRPPSPKKAANQPKSPQKSPKKAAKEVVVLDSDNSSDSDGSDSSEDVCLADLKPLIASQKSNSPKKTQKQTKSPSKGGRSPSKQTRSPSKQTTPKKLVKSNAKEKKGGEKKVVKRGPKPSPAKSKQNSPTKKKNMKQMTLFDMSKKGNVSSPKKPRSKPASPVKQPAIVSKIQKAMLGKNKITIGYLLSKAAKELSGPQRKNLPPDIRDAVMKRHSKMEEKRKLKMMSEREKEEYFKQKREEKKKENQEKLVEMRKQKLELSKRYEDAHLDGSDLTPPLLVPTPDGMPNELFGEVAMVTQFILAYKGLLMPEDDFSINAESLMTSLTTGKEGLAYLTKVLVVLLQTLLQDEIAEDYKELTMQLGEIPVNQYTASEIVRLVLRKHDQDDGNADDDKSDDSDVNANADDNEVSEELIETLASCELYELTSQEKLEILQGLAYRLMGSYSVQDYMSEKQQQAAELWKKRIAQLKMKNDKLKEAKQKRKELKEQGKDVSMTEEENKASGTGMDISSFYGQSAKDDGEDTDDITSVVKRRRVMAAKAAAEKEIRERERRLRCEKEYQEMKKQRELEQFEKQFEDGVALSKMVFRIQPIGTDRNHSRYWIFHSSMPGLYVEKGWAQDMTTTDEKKKESGNDSDTSEESSMPLNNLLKDGQETTFPHLGQNLWFVYDSLEGVDQLLESLHVQGIRESELKQKIKKHYQRIEDGFNASKKSDSPPSDAPPQTSKESKETLLEVDLLEGMKQELTEMDSKLRNGGLGGVDHLALWTKKVETATSASELCESLLDLQSAVMEKFLKGLMAKYKARPKVKKVKEEVEEVAEEENEGEDSDDKYCPFLERWRDAVTSCTTLSRLHLLLGMLDSCIKWEKSAENAKCKICRKKGEDVKMLLCDDCNQPFHLYCLRPAILEIPKGDWFCPACVPLSQRQCRRNTNYRELAGETDSTQDDSDLDEDDEEESEDEEEEERKSDSNCIVCGGDEGLATCSTCPSAFHLECHQPPLKFMPRSTTWVCIQCKTGKRIKKKKSIWLPTASMKAKPTTEDEDEEEEEEEESSDETDDGKRRTRSRRKNVSYNYDDDEDEDEETEEEEDEDSEAEDEAEETTPTRRSNRSSTGSQSGSRSRRSGEQNTSLNSSRKSNRASTDNSQRRGSGRGTENSARRYNDDSSQDKEHQHILEVLQRINRHRLSWPFHEPVDPHEVPDYYTIIKQPIDLQKIRVKFSEGRYRGAAGDFLSDIALMFDNACEYNRADSEVGKCVPLLEKVFTDLVVRLLPDYTYSRQPKDCVLNDHAYSSRKRLSR